MLNLSASNIRTIFRMAYKQLLGLRIQGSPKGLNTTIYDAGLRLDTNSPEAATVHTSFTWHRFRTSVDSLDGDTGRSPGEALRRAGPEQRLRSEDEDSDNVDKT